MHVGIFQCERPQACTSLMNQNTKASHVMYFKTAFFIGSYCGSKCWAKLLHGMNKHFEAWLLKENEKILFHEYAQVLLGI